MIGSLGGRFRLGHRLRTERIISLTRGVKPTVGETPNALHADLIAHR